MDLREKVASDLMMVWFLMGHSRFGNDPRTARRGHEGGRRKMDPTQGQGRIVAMLKLRDGLSTKDMSTVLGIRVSSLNELLSKMEKAELIERRPSEADKRIVLTWLTDKGREVELPEENKLDLLEGFSDEELEILAGYLDRMIANLENQVGSETVEAFRSAMAEREALFGDSQGAPGPGPFSFMPPFGGHRPMPMPQRPHRGPSRPRPL